MVIYVCFSVKTLKIACNFDTKIFGSIKNYVRHGKTHMHQEVGDGCIIVKYYYDCTSIETELIDMVEMIKGMCK